MSLPGNINTITVTGTYLSGTGAAQGGTVTFTPTSALTDPAGSTVVANVPIVAAVSQSTGSFTQAGLACTDNTTLLPSGWCWTVNVAVPGAAQVFTTFLPHTLGSTVDISTLMPLPQIVAPSGVWFNPNAATPPSGTPVGGGWLYTYNGTLYWRGSSGTLTQLGAA
jgi:hypothetical protein